MEIAQINIGQFFKTPFSTKGVPDIIKLILEGSLALAGIIFLVFLFSKILKYVRIIKSIIKNISRRIRSSIIHKIKHIIFGKQNVRFVHFSAAIFLSLPLTNRFLSWGEAYQQLLQIYQ